MDAISIERKRDYNRKRLKRWSMNSQRLEEIVAALMKPISDLSHSFDTDLSTLLEEYLTEAGLRALEEEEEEEGGEGCGAVDMVKPNFAELALLVQHCASVYGKKVDFLYQQVLSVSKSTQNASLELSNETPAETTTPGGSKRRRKSAGACPWGDIALEPAPGGARREPSVVPPPTLPRLFAELQPRALTKHDVQLTDLAGEPIGLLSDFHVTQRLQDGFLMDDLECRRTALGAAASPVLPSPKPTTPTIPTTPVPLDHSTPTPLPLDHSTPSPLPRDHSTPTPTPAPLDSIQDTLLLKKGRKRRNDVNIDSLPECTFKLHITEELRARLLQAVDFSVPGAWVAAVVAARARRLREARGAARLAERTDRAGFQGFDYCAEAGGFAGWAECERVSSATTALQLQRLSESSARCDIVSDDDGFFSERSSLHSDDSPQHTLSKSDSGVASGWWESSEWLCRVVAAPARAFDVREVAARVLAALPPPAPAVPSPTPFKRLLAATARQHTDVSRIFLATLFLANAGNVEVCPEPPHPDASAHAVGSFGVRALSREPRLYTELAAAEPALGPLAPAAPPAPPV